MPKLLPVAVLIAAAAAAAPAWAVDYAGTYRGPIKGQPAAVELHPDGPAYAGTITVGTAALPCRANPRADGLAGTFSSNGTDFPFTATVAGDAMTLSTGGATYALTRPPANPLDAAPSAPPPAAAELARTATGRTLVLAQPTATTAQAALDAVLPNLPAAVGGAVAVTGRFADTRSGDRGGASFTAVVHGRPVHGVAFCGRSTDGGEEVAVAYAATDAPPAEWQTLTAALPRQVALHPYSFPDGTGTIGLPDGWTCRTQSACDPILADGPDGQRVTFGQSFTVNGPQSPAAQAERQIAQSDRDLAAQQEQINAQLRQMGARPVAAPPMPERKPAVAFGMFFGRFDDPVAMLQAVYPQLSQCLVLNGQPPEQIDRILAATPATPQMPGGRADLLSELWTSGTGPAAEHFHSECRIESAPLGTDATLIEISDLRAHADCYARCLPTLWAVAQSFQPDADRCQQVTEARCKAMNEQMQRQAASMRQQQQLNFEAGQRRHDEQAASFDRFESTMRAQSDASHRSAANFSEYLSGYQKIVNTDTGEVRHVDYSDSTGIVAGLNEQANSPNQWTVVHRGDEQYPAR